MLAVMHAFNPIKGKIYKDHDHCEYTEEDVSNSEIKLLAYAHSKVEAERDASAKAKDLGVHLVVVCPGLVVGPHMGLNELSLSLELVAGVVKTKEPNPGFEAGLWASVDVRDVAKTMIAAFENPDAKGRYLCMQKHTFDMKTLSKGISAALGDIGIMEVYPAASVRRFDNSRCLELIGGSLIDEETMVKDTLRALRSTGRV